MTLPNPIDEPLSRAEFLRASLTVEIERMLTDLGNPPLVDRIFPNGWRNANDQGLQSLYDLCVRTYQSRAKP
jgi:hypothetical protein